MLMPANKNSTVFMCFVSCLYSCFPKFLHTGLCMCSKMIIYCLRATKLNLQSHAGIVLSIKMLGEIFGET